MMWYVCLCVCACGRGGAEVEVEVEVEHSVNRNGMEPALTLYDTKLYA